MLSSLGNFQKHKLAFASQVMANQGGYILQRDGQESKRLNAQHHFMVALSGGHLTHPSIPLGGFRTVADVGTGTGIWLKRLAVSPAFAMRPDGDKTTFVGFDISPQQFPPADELLSNLCFKIQDIREPSPVEYHERFDFVNVRLLSYVIKAVDLEKIVRHILQILRKDVGLWLRDYGQLTLHLQALADSCNGKSAMLAIVGRSQKRLWRQLRSVVSSPRRLPEVFFKGKQSPQRKRLADCV